MVINRWWLVLDGGLVMVDSRWLVFGGWLSVFLVARWYLVVGG